MLREHPVAAHELDDGGAVGDAAVERWVASARQEYLDRCVVLRQVRERSGLELTSRAGELPRGVLLGRPTSVAVSASASELWPSSFTISVRLRPLGGDRDTALNTTCVVSLVDAVTGEAHPLGKEVRDELIALEHSARHFN